MVSLISLRSHSAPLISEERLDRPTNETAPPRRASETAVLIVFALLALLYYVSSSGVVGATQTQGGIAGSQYVPDILLALFRTVAAALSVFTLISICTDEEGSLSLPTFYDSRQNEEVLLLGVHRLVPFTVWSFAAFGLYFSVAAASSWVLVLGGEIPEWALAVVPLAFATACGTALLVTSVVTFYLIPNNAAKGYDVRKYFEWHEMLMHNGNVIILGADLVLGDNPLVNPHPFRYARFAEGDVPVVDAHRR